MVNANDKKSNINENHTFDGGTIPDDAIEALARTLYPAMVAFFESEEGQRKFATGSEGESNGVYGEVADCVTVREVRAVR